MPNKKISWLLNIQVDGGPKISIPNSVDVEAYDVIEAVIPKQPTAGTPGTVKISVQPSPVTNIKILLIGLMDPAQYDPKISYSVEAAEPDETKRIKLDAAQFLVGNGAVGLYGKNLDAFHFYNNTAKDATVQILVGRKATA
jgi:hypothetical protein